MALDTIQFVDSISASPTVALDLNSTDFKTRLVSFTPGQMRYAMSDNMMSNGVNVSSSATGASELVLELDCLTANQDANATALQQLSRQLDKPTNLIKYQPNGLTKPVFFKTYRTSIRTINDIAVQAAMRQVTIGLMCEPFALGLQETISVGTVNNDPAAGSNGCYFDVTGVIGDVAAPCVIVDATTSNERGVLAVRQHGTPSDLAISFLQGESYSGSGGGVSSVADAGASNGNAARYTLTGSELFASWSLTGTAVQRLAMRGAYRVMAVVKPSASGATFTARAEATGGDNSNKTITGLSSGSRYVVDLGLVYVGDDMEVRTGGNSSPSPSRDLSLLLYVNRTSGTGNLDVDFLALIPADESQLIFESVASGYYMGFDTELESLLLLNSGDNYFDGTGRVNFDTTRGVSGGYPSLVPNQTNRFFYLKWTGNNVWVKAGTSSITVDYWPRYIFVRPSAT